MYLVCNVVSKDINVGCLKYCSMQFRLIHSPARHTHTVLQSYLSRQPLHIRLRCSHQDRAGSFRLQQIHLCSQNSRVEVSSWANSSLYSGHRVRPR